MKRKGDIQKWEKYIKPKEIRLFEGSISGR